MNCASNNAPLRKLCLVSAVVLLSSFKLAFAQESEEHSNPELHLGDIGAPPIVATPEALLEESEDLESERRKPEDLVNLNYFAILYGPSVQSPTSFQPNAEGQPDPERPVIVKNFLSAGHRFTENLAVAGIAYWIWQPVRKQELQLQDPFVRVSYNSIFNYEGFNLYGDVRTHFPVTDMSRQNDLLFGLQTFQGLTYDIPRTYVSVGLYVSERVNFFGQSGVGNDFEFYLAPNAYYRMTDTLTLTLLFEIQRNHLYGTNAFPLTNEGTDIEPGIAWDITPQLMVNPYLHIPTDKGIRLSSTSIGMMLSWTFL